MREEGEEVREEGEDRRGGKGLICGKGKKFSMQ